MKIRTTSTLLLCMLCLISFSQNEKAYRKGFTLKLPVDGEHFYEQKVEKSLYFVKENVLQIYPGEKLFIEVDKTNNEINSMKIVKNNINPEKTILLEFTQNIKDRKSESMILKIVNPFDNELNYKAMMFVVGHNKLIETNVLPIKSKLIGYETWNDVIISLVLYDWKLK